MARVASFEFQDKLRSVRERTRSMISQSHLPWGYLDNGIFLGPPPIILDSVQKESALHRLLAKPDDEPIIAVLGVGYVGSHLVTSFSKQFRVIGYDVSKQRIEQLRQQNCGNDVIAYTNEPGDIVHATHFLISVPTLLKENRSIDSSYLEDAIKTVAKFARRGSTVVVESSVAVGMTRELLGPVAKQYGLFAGMSPERVDPGRTEPPVQSIPKIISGLDDIVPGSQQSIYRVYRQIFDTVIQVSKPEVAEMMKLYENCQRMVCIAYANEMADACVSIGIDPFEVCNAASTKPFGYMPYAPGVGVGGHCIPVNPFYLLSNSSFPLLEAATEAMWSRPGRLADRALASLQQLPPKEARASILVVGMGFKVGQSCLSNSPGLDLAKSLVHSGTADVAWADALVPQDSIPEIARLADSEWTKDILQTFDMIIVVFRQTSMDFDVLGKLDGVRVEMWCK